MPATKKNISENLSKNDKINHHEDLPFIIEKNQQAKAFLDKYGFPKQIVDRARKK